MSWTTENLGSFCRLVNGKAFKADDWSESGWPIIRIQNLNDATKPFNYWNGGLERQVHVRNGDLLIAWSGTPGTSFGAHIWEGLEGVLNQHIFRVDLTNGNVTKEWLKFCVNTQLLRLIDQAHGGVGLKHVTKGAVESVEIPLPPLAEQKRIAAILDAADALRAKRRESLAQLDTLIQSTFLEMFGDPVTNPKGWKIAPLQSLVDANRPITYGILKPGPDVDNGIPYVRVVDIQSGQVLTGQLRRTTAEIADQYKRSRLKLGDLLMSIRGHVGRMAIAPEDTDGANITQDTARLALVGVETPYVMQCIATQGMQHYMDRRTKGVAVRGINLGDVKQLPVPIPPPDHQRRFATIVDLVERQKARLRAHLAELDTLFASLQSRAFNGEV